jgi:leader peptidase (prepilin peptidase)/N-methyltransferase
LVLVYELLFLAIISFMITYILAIIPGWVCGMVVNYLADALPLRRKLTRPFCIQCDASQPWLSYLVWPRKCQECHYRRSMRVWLVEVFYVAASVLVAIYPPRHLGYGLGMLVLAFFGVVVVIDLEYRLIMHPVSIFGAVLGLVVGILRVGWLSALIGGALGFGIMWLLYMLGALIIKLVNRRRGVPVTDVALGFGDVNLSGVLGLMLGWQLILAGLVLAVLIGGVVSLIVIVVKLMRRKYEAFMAVPYGPFLVLGAVAFIFFADQLAVLLRG